jgi:hypothetical protein
MEEQVQQEVTAPTNITGCTFTTEVVWDQNVSEAVLTVAQALLNLTELFKNSRVEVIGIKVLTKTEKEV